MTTAEFKLAATAAGMLLLLVGSVAWVIYDWLQAREKRKRQEDYNRRYTLWFNQQFIASLKAREETVQRCWVRLDIMRGVLDDFEDEDRWEQRFQEALGKRLKELGQDGRTGRTKIDYYQMKREDV